MKIKIISYLSTIFALIGIIGLIFNPCAFWMFITSIGCILLCLINTTLIDKLNEIDKKNN